jgi:hypothetical protein
VFFFFLRPFPFWYTYRVPKAWVFFNKFSVFIKKKKKNINLIFNRIIFKKQMVLLVLN